MPRGRHSLVPTTSRGRSLALVTAPLVTVAVVATGVAAGDPDRATAPAGAAISAPQQQRVAEQPSEERTLGTSRSQERVPLVDQRPPEVARKLWSTAPLKIRVKPTEGSRSVATFAEDQRIGVTGERRGGYAEVVYDEQARWVTASYLSKKKVVEKAPAPAASGGSSSSGGTAAASGVSGAPCPDGSDIEAGLQPAAVKVYRAVCNAFPELSAYGGQDGHGEHVNGQAIDFMASGSLGERVKDYLYANRAAFDLFDIIWSQTIWTIERSGEGFRSMEDRGSATANHFDHVHIKVN
ncbi:SH3 domain-containing protein [Marmoricola sp. Leaf446]|uniref:SH3 domain-containing protein n=1 Tax=Marmoricola sp. Leaf446 TaxID=1736379 RepID=UPI000AA83D94|nr:SH3 domain-containing protein [Marmoricola sp. Leaf446]